MSESDLLIHAERRIGSVLCGKYRLDSVLGVGGMAVVFAATHRNQKRVAIKMLHPELSIHEELRTRFLREGYAANTVDHPGAVAVLDDDTAEDGVAFLVMERLEGDEVDRLWEAHGRALGVQVVLALASQLLDVLAAAHAKSIIHRDIKPSNLYVTRDGTLKVLDFGIARVRDAASSGASATSTGMMLGTPAYMAPEQALGKSKEIDATTDLWSVGATLFTLLSGRFVHEGESVTQLVVLSATTPARSLAAVAPHIDPRVVALVDRALSFTRAGRWPSALAMRDAVRATYAQLFGAKLGKEPLLRLLGVEPEETAPTELAIAAVPLMQAATPAPQAFTKAGQTLDDPAPMPRTREMTARPALPGERPPHPVQPAPGMGPMAPAYAPPPGYAPGGLVVAQAPMRTPGAATTAYPVSTEQDAAAGIPKKNPYILPAAVLGILVGVGGGLWYGLSTGSRAAPAGAGLVTQATTPLAPLPTPVAPPSSPEPAVPPSAPASSAPRSAPPPPPRAVVTPFPPRATTSKPNCNPEYTIDPTNGHHVPKPECL
jgi:hypothetical protein